MVAKLGFAAEVGVDNLAGCGRAVWAEEEKRLEGKLVIGGVEGDRTGKPQELRGDSERVKMLVKTLALSRFA